MKKVIKQTFPVEESIEFNLEKITLLICPENEGFKAN